jgi:hypothetical protein
VATGSFLLYGWLVDATSISDIGRLATGAGISVDYWFFGVYWYLWAAYGQSPANGESEENGRVRNYLVEYKRSCSPCCCRVVGCEWKCIAPTTGNGGRNGGLLFLESGYEILYTFV